MNWINLHIATLDGPEFVGSSPKERGIWLSLLRFCIGQENSGRISFCKSWKDRQWQQLIRVTKKEVSEPCRLWEWDGEDLVVFFYPVDKEEEVERKRETARANGAKGGRPPKKPTSETQTEPKSDILEKAERERNRKENSNRASVSDAEGIEIITDSEEIRQAWSEWQSYRQARHKATGKQKLMWTEQAARMSIKQILSAVQTFGTQIVCDRIAAAIAGGWQGLNFDKLHQANNGNDFHW